VCSHARRSTIEAAAENSKSLAAVAARYKLSERSLAAHLEKHARTKTPATLKKPVAKVVTVEIGAGGAGGTASRAESPPPAPLGASSDAEEAAPPTSRSPTSASTARAKLDDLLVSLRKLADSIGGDATVGERIAVFRASVAPIKLLGQLTGELGASEATVAASPHYRRIREAIVAALEEHPEALRAVERALARLEPGAATDERAA
jgi:hypothetical protein